MPGDLNLKKSWNPALVKNQKKVWEKEQEALKELKAIKERSKEIEREREKEEMIRLQYGNDPNALPQDKKIELNKLSWMYEGGPKKDSDKVNESGFREVEEDFLLKQTDLELLIKKNGTSKRGKAKETSGFDRIANLGKSLAPRLALSDDPLLAIRREQRKQTSLDSSRSHDRSDRHSRSHSKRSCSERDHSPSRRHRERGSSDRSSSDRSSHRRKRDESTREGKEKPASTINY